MFCVKVLNECVGIICYVGCWVVFDMSVCMFVIEVFVMDAMNVVFFVKNANTPLSAFLMMMFLLSWSDLIAASV